MIVLITNYKKLYNIIYFLSITAKKSLQKYKKRLPERTAYKTGVEGIEPSLKVLETSVIPFDHTPISTTILV